MCVCVCVLCRFLGKLLSQYISVYVQDGIRRVQIIIEGFDYERWKKRKQVSMWRWACGGGHVEVGMWRWACGGEHVR